MLPPLAPIASRYLTLPEFQLSPIGRLNNNERQQDVSRNVTNDGHTNSFNSRYESANSGAGFSSYGNTQLSSRIELSTWIGGL